MPSRTCRRALSRNDSEAQTALLLIDLQSRIVERVAVDGAQLVGTSEVASAAAAGAMVVHVVVAVFRPGHPEVSAHEGRVASPRRDHHPDTLAAELERVRIEYNTIRLHMAIATSLRRTNTTDEATRSADNEKAPASRRGPPSRTNQPLGAPSPCSLKNPRSVAPKSDAPHLAAGGMRGWTRVLA